MIAGIKQAIIISVVLVTFTSAAWGAEPGSAQSQKMLTVNELAAKPAAHLGRVTVVGVVATVNPGKGFLLIDSEEYRNCGLGCLTQAGTRKIPVDWTGATPKVKQTVRVDGVLEKTVKGFFMKAERVGRQ